ncbi:hypothetical protein [Halobacterium noricense]|uniref:hypothetical protein n=1 Tax=Halobacterium noricense TaxID=223182 RepID=UPI001E305F7A|nr:hypothetical protein [Halobacterium noricense]UHH27222.1 hypothetical protein LT974_16400 [Halobacterium noricense]
MMTDGQLQFRDTLLVERVVNAFHFDVLAERIPGLQVYPPYLFLVVLLVWDFGIMNTVIHVTGGRHIFAMTPTAVASIPGLLLAIVGIRYMADGYAEALADLRLPERQEIPDVASFEQLVSNRANAHV